jgi:hypothetical protein
MEGDMLDYATLALSVGNLRGNAKAKAVRASYEFWSTGDEALLEDAFAEIFGGHAVLPLGETTGSVQPAASGPRKKDSKETGQAKAFRACCDP